MPPAQHWSFVDDWKLVFLGKQGCGRREAGKSVSRAQSSKGARLWLKPSWGRGSAQAPDFTLPSYTALVSHRLRVPF